MNYFKKIFLKYEHRGIGYLGHYFLKKIGYKTKYSSFIHKKKSYLEKKIFDLTNGVVRDGIYKSMKLSKFQNWKNFSDCDLSPKLIGIYEEQVQNKIVQLIKDYDLKYLVNFGSGEGYHAIGLIKNNYFEKCICFEIDDNTREILKINSKLNNIENKIKIYEEADFKIVLKELSNDQLKKTLFLVDIEGHEFSLYNKDNLNYIKKSFHIIENHEDYFRDKKKILEFYKIMNNNFLFEKLKNTSRNPFDFDEIKFLPDDERWLMVSEGRPCEMNWLIYRPIE
tara:strand:- start:468 stop:1310 length:843 start_codon:yes stop_codon:yes gene_type:complete